ncbi:MAG TPA: hypothetical protein VMA36_20855 [Candidatus Limnocylindria bacterium]|nr:hypothetical protein [Candidatus Limnocylindria bacterium]
MPDVRVLAAEYGVRIELDDLGSWSDTRLVAEYDPEGPVIRLNERAMPHGSSCVVREHIDRAIAHELYHHREAIGEVPRLHDRAARERAADAYADELLA